MRRLAMIREAQDAALRDAVSVAILPHRSLSRVGLIVYLVAQSVVALGFACLAAARGIVLAPVFAVLALAATAWCVVRVWRATASGEIVTITPHDVEIAGAARVHYHPYWVRVRLREGRWPGWPCRLMLGSHGRETEVGAFLNDAERRELAQRLERLLHEANSRGGTQELGTR